MPLFIQQFSRLQIAIDVAGVIAAVGFDLDYAELRIVNYEEDNSHEESERDALQDVGEDDDHENQ